MDWVLTLDAVFLGWDFVEKRHIFVRLFFVDEPRPGRNHPEHVLTGEGDFVNCGGE